MFFNIHYKMEVETDMSHIIFFIKNFIKASFKEISKSQVKVSILNLIFLLKKSLSK